MLVIGGCELSLERNPYDSVESIDFRNYAQSSNFMKLAIPARGATAHLINDTIWVLGGCKGKREHLNSI